MSFFVEVVNGRLAGLSVPLWPGKSINVGSAAGSDLFVPYDGALAPLHFLLRNSGDKNVCQVKKMMRETLVNGERIDEHNAVHGDFIIAGGTLFALTRADEKSPHETPIAKLTDMLVGRPDLYVLVDSGKDEMIGPILKQLDSPPINVAVRIPVEGRISGVPVLGQIGRRYDVLEKLVRAYWGSGTLVIFEARGDLFTICSLVSNVLGRPGINGFPDLRIYDPRVLRLVLAECGKADASAFFSFATRFWLESQVPGFAITYSLKNGVQNAELIPLGVEP